MKIDSQFHIDLPDSDMESHVRGVGGVLFCHNLSIDNKYLTSSEKNLVKSLIGSYSDCLAQVRVEVRVTLPAGSASLCKAAEPASPIEIKL